VLTKALATAIIAYVMHSKARRSCLCCVNSSSSDSNHCICHAQQGQAQTFLLCVFGSRRTEGGYFGIQFDLCLMHVKDYQKIISLNVAIKKYILKNITYIYM
jgi:hypothetical protein